MKNSRNAVNRRCLISRALCWIAFATAISFFLAECCQHLQIYPSSRRAAQGTRETQKAGEPKRLLYIVTTLREFDSGRRATHRGFDRFSLTLLPTIVESTTSLAQEYNVKLFLIAHYKLPESRKSQMKNSLPHNVTLEVWDDASPLGYKPRKSANDTIRDLTMGLSRQHRFVIKDALPDFDVFCSFEDDMIVRSSHVSQFVRLTDQLAKARAQAPVRNRHSTIKEQSEDFYGGLTQSQYKKLIPGWIRVEAGLPGWKPHDENKLPQVPMNWEYDGNKKVSLNSTYCCHVTPETALLTKHTPESPLASNLYFWETGLDALSVRKLSNDIGWVVMLAGNYVSRQLGSYWSGRDGYFKELPKLMRGRYSNNQGGWMATRAQIIEWHTEVCPGGLLPPFSGRTFAQDGLRHTVETWSGGLQLSGQSQCKLQRVIPLDPPAFERQLLYHSSNNKQRSANVQHRFSSHSIEEFWAQLNTVRKNAEEVMKILKKS